MEKQIALIIDEEYNILKIIKSLTPYQMYKLSELLKTNYPNKNEIEIYKFVKRADEHINFKLQPNIILNGSNKDSNFIIKSIVNLIDCFLEKHHHS
jgi:hypothetical protein